MVYLWTTASSTVLVVVVAPSPKYHWNSSALLEVLEKVTLRGTCPLVILAVSLASGAPLHPATIVASSASVMMIIKSFDCLIWTYLVALFTESWKNSKIVPFTAKIQQF